MRKSIATALSATAITVGITGGTSALTAAPAQADTASCINVLLYYGVENTVGNEVCQVTEALGDTAIPGYAGMPCNLALQVAVGVPAEVSEEACTAAIQP